MKNEDKKYFKLDPKGISKRLNEVQDNLKSNQLENKGLHKTLNHLLQIIEIEIPNLGNEIKKRRFLVYILNIFLVSLAICLIAFIFIPNPLNTEILTKSAAKANYINSTMSIIVGLVVTIFSLSLWAKRQTQNAVRKTTDDIHELIHRIDMYQLGKSKWQIIPNKLENSELKLKIYVNGIHTSIKICGKLAALIYHLSDDDQVTESARHLEFISTSLATQISKKWQSIVDSP